LVHCIPELRMLKSQGRSDVETIVKDQDLIGRRHGQICDAALKLFSRKGYRQTSVREIAEACGLGIGTP
jgi:AcrR family transcriptional regulator